MASESYSKLPKFVIRFPEGSNMRELVDERATQEFTSMNAFILQAIKEKLDRDHRLDRLLDLVSASIK